MNGTAYNGSAKMGSVLRTTPADNPLSATAEQPCTSPAPMIAFTRAIAGPHKSRPPANFRRRRRRRKLKAPSLYCSMRLQKLSADRPRGKPKKRCRQGDLISSLTPAYRFSHLAISQRRRRRLLSSACRCCRCSQCRSSRRFLGSRRSA